MDKEQDKITLALKEIGYGEIKVTIQDGVIIKIPKQRVFCNERHGIKKEIVIDGEIKR